MSFIMSSWTAVTLVLLGTILPLAYLFFSMQRNLKWPTNPGINGRLPPGPSGLPILGNLLRLGDRPHRTLEKLAKRYGPIMHMQLGQVSTIIVSSRDAARQFLKTQDLVFASRPITEVGRYISYNLRAVTFSQYGNYWRNARKLYTLELLSNLKIVSFKSVRREEIGLSVQLLKNTAKARAAADLTAMVASLTRDMVSRMVLGKKFTDEDFDNRGFKGVVEELMYVIGAFNISDYIPCLRALDLQGLRRRMMAVGEVFDYFFEKIIDEHERHQDSRDQKDFIDIMLSFMESKDGEFQFDRMNIKAILLETLVAAVDTTATTIDWALSELLSHPRVMKKFHEELDATIGLARTVEESDLPKLEYLDMVVKETMRLHPVVPILIPHEAMEDCTIDAFYIPKKSRIIINAWAIGRDPNSWPNPEEFYPERFIGTSIDVRGQDFQLLPFGSGRRGCPGIQLGLIVVRLVLAQMVHCFDWELPNGMSPSELDMSEKFGLVMPRIKHLWAIPTYRLKDGI